MPASALPTPRTSSTTSPSGETGGKEGDRLVIGYIVLGNHGCVYELKVSCEGGASGAFRVRQVLRCVCCCA
ncbi:hypothetical protein E2C01_090228 [Portunus trituberculatus]|uniref:Uncharacterized protein n=1 Tax=Portunus trituberculatus TaxID=210409 RepID=A0A5B7JKC9_PORTR|nr:hypothetical protein [Portunus trituberculatus]